MSKAMLPVIRELSRFLKSSRGQSLVEYTLVLSFISLLSIVLMSILGVQVRGLYTSIINALDIVRNAI